MKPERRTDSSHQVLQYQPLAVVADGDPAYPPLRSDIAPRPQGPSEDLLGPGVRINQYEIIRELGSGGMGTVFLARDNRLGRRVAIKFLHTDNPELTSRFLVEAQATARCSHENIVVVYEVGQFGGRPFIVLEYLQGQTLASMLARTDPMPFTRVVELISSVMKALVSAHDQGIVHRDLKPENILMTYSGTVKVLDFGIAKVLRDQPRDADENPVGGAGVRLGGRSGIVGTIAYMSPEQWGVGGDIDRRTDIWATGIILFQLLSGSHPYDWIGDQPIPRVLDLDAPMPSLGEVAPRIPRALAELVDGCLRKRKEERVPDARTLLVALEPFLPGRLSRPVVSSDRSPYAGLRAFNEEDAGRFFGRTREIAAMLTQLRDWPLMAVVGPSGVGKSSFVRAGVVPALKSSGENWEAMVIRPGRDPILALASMLEPLVSTTVTIEENLNAQRELTVRLYAEPGYFGTALRSSARLTGKKLLVFVDQFEELYTLGTDPRARRAFTACLAAAADDPTSPTRVVISIRSDFLGRAAEDPPFMNELARGLFLLGAPQAEGLREALVEPAEMAGYRFESPEMVDEMLHHLEATPGALPLLQFTAAQLWEGRDTTRKILTERSYQALGGIAGAVVSHADRVVAKLTPELRDLCRALFLALVTPERTRAVRDLDELGETLQHQGDLGRLVDHLVDSRLLFVQTGGASGGTSVEIVHESLIGGWPTLRRWLDESHEDTLFLDQLCTAGKQWHTKKHDAGLLWGGDMVEELSRFRRRFRGELPEIAEAFVAAVLEQHARGARRRRTLRASGAVFLLGLLAAAAIALVVIRNAQKAAEKHAIAATQAEAFAQNRLRDVEAKERERQRAEALRAVAEKDAAHAHSEVEHKNEELAAKNVELTQALTQANEESRRAQEAKGKAEENARVALAAEDRAKQSARQLESALERERERADRLNQQLGSTLVEVLR